MPNVFMKQILMRSLFVSAVVLLAISSLSKFAWNPYLEILSHFQTQYLVVGAILTVLLAVQRHKLGLSIGAICLAILLAEILPWYIPPAWTQANPEPNLRILLSNVYVVNRSYDKVLDLVKAENPDIAVFQEVNQVWAEQLRSLQSTFPYILQTPDDITIYSKRPFQSPAMFGNPDKPSLAAKLIVNQQPITLVTTHPLPPKPNLFDARNAQLADVSQYIQSQKTPIVLIGDLNTSMWSPYYRQLIQETGLRNSRQGFQLLPTWPVVSQYGRIPGFFAPLAMMVRIPLDHCLTSPTIQTAGIRVGESVESDHLPLITDLWIPPRSDLP